MPVKHDMWIEGHEAASIMSQNSGHSVSPDYVRLLSNQGKIRSRAKDGRTKEYHKTDVEKYRVKGNKSSSSYSAPPESVEELLNIRQVAQQLGVSERTVYRLIEAEELHPFKMGKSWKFVQSDIHAYIESLRSKAKLAGKEDPAA